MSEPQTGDVLGGKYRIERVLGEGGMGLVVQATHLALDQKVAIKFLKTEALLHPEIVERFKREARASVRVRGPHVARVIDVDQTPDGRPFMVMEYMNGEDLSVVLEQRGALTVEEAATYVLQACDAIAEAHAAKIVHRDIKPANLFLAHGEGRRPMVKVLDFGISKLQDPSQGSMTQTLAILGSPHYMSPEQLRASKNVDHRADIWSLGVTLYELLTGARPFEAETLPEIITAIVLNEPPKVRAIRPDVPEAVEEIVSRCMKAKADERYQNVAELARALEPFAEPGARHLASGISRMLLGVTVPPPREPAAAPVLEIIAPASQSSPPPAPAPTGLPISTAVTMVGPASAATGATTGGSDRASDLVTEQPRSGRGVYVLAIAAAFVALGVGFFAIRGTQGTSAAPLPNVTPPSTVSAEPKLDPLPTAPPTPPTVASAPAIEPPVASASASAQHPTHASVGAKPPPSARPTTAATAPPPPSSAPSHAPTVVATAPTPPPSSTATSAPTSTTTQAPKNPLQMGLK